MGTAKSAAASKSVTAVFSSLFLILYVLKYLRQCVRKPYESTSSFKYMALNWAQINIIIYIELFLGSTDLHFSLGTQDVPFCTCVHQQVLQKLSLID